MKWQRLVDFNSIPQENCKETWLKIEENIKTEYSVDVTYGKKIDILSLKGTNLTEIREYADYLKDSASKLYAEDVEKNAIKNCPSCRLSTKDNVAQCYKFIDIPFHRCKACGHGFVLNQPNKNVLDSVFKETEDYSSVYIDKGTLETRMSQIISPKLEWTTSVYKKLYNKNPITGLDVGAGGGHFVEGMRRAGMNAKGFELSNASRKFALEAFELSLEGKDFLKSAEQNINLITFWGLLEYTQQPLDFIEAAYNSLSKEDGLLIVEVPRIDCIGTAVQSINPFNIARHMDPTSHVNTFSDMSLVTMLAKSKFKPVAAWYFGMDIYELLIQIALRLENSKVIDIAADMIPILQYTLDQGRVCDDIVIAASPDYV